MATVTGKTAAAMDAIMNDVIVSAAIDGSGHLILTHHDASTSDAGAVLGSVPNASTTVSGVIKTADNGTTSTGTDTTRAVTPAGLASVLSVISAAISGLQPLDSDLTAIAGLSPANDDVMQRKSGAWANRTLTQLAADLTSSLLQPKDADLTAIAGLSPAANDSLQFKSGAWANRTMAQFLVDIAAAGAAIGYLYNGSIYVAVNTPGVYVGSADPGSVPNGSVWYTV